jgi:hypothetical protein
MGDLLAQPKSAGCGFGQNLIFSVIIVVTVGALTATKHDELPTVKDETATTKGPDNAVYPGSPPRRSPLCKPVRRQMRRA